MDEVYDNNASASGKSIPLKLIIIYLDLILIKFPKNIFISKVFKKYLQKISIKLHLWKDQQSLFFKSRITYCAWFNKYFIFHLSISAADDTQAFAEPKIQSSPIIEGPEYKFPDVHVSLGQMLFEGMAEYEEKFCHVRKKLTLY